MGVEGAVQHQDRGMDRRERSRVYAFVPFFKPIGRSVYNGLQANLVQKRAAPISRRAHVELSDCGRFVVLHLTYARFLRIPSPQAPDLVVARHQNG